jgi:O-antigen/teichoic acid export membrane protein
LLFAPAALLNASSLALPVICAGMWFEVEDAGQWGMAERILALPLVIVAAALGQLVEARLAQHHRERSTGSVPYFLRVSGVLAGFSVIVAAVVLLAGREIVVLLLGDQWRDAASIMQLLLPMLITRIVASPMSRALVVAQWAVATVWLDAGRALLVVAVLLSCWSYDVSLDVLVIATSVAFALVYIATWLVGLAAAKELDSAASTDAREA